MRLEGYVYMWEGRSKGMCICGKGGVKISVYVGKKE